MTTPDPKATLPSGKIIIEEAPFDGAHHGRVDGDWRPVAEEAPADNKQYARQNGGWSEVTAEGVDYGTGLTKDVSATPPIVNLQPATDFSIGGIMEPPQTPPDSKQYVRVYDPTLPEGWKWAEATAEGVDFGIGLSKDETAAPPIVHLQPAGDSPATLGGVYVVDRVRNVEEGLELGIDGRLRAPLATDSLAGTLLEPPPDDKGYVRARSAAGVSAWVPPAETLIDFGTGLTKDETATPPIVHLQPATDFSIGGVMEPAQNGLAHSRQFDTLTQSWFWTPALTAGLQITSIIPDKAIYGPSEPLLTVHAYGMEFTGTCVIRVDGNDATTSYVSATELTFVLNPAVPISEQFHIITVHETAPTPVDGLGAEQFDFIVASIAVDYGKGLSFDTSTDPPIVNLDPAGPTNLGGVKVSVRDATTQGLQIDFGDAALGDPATGELWAPPATPDLLGTIIEPPADAKGYVRTTQLDGTSQWVPPAPSETLIAGNAPKDLGSVYVPARNDHNQGLDLNGDGGLYAPPATHEHLGTLLEPPEENKQYARFRDPTTHNNQWVEVEGGMEEPPMEPVQTWGRSSGGVRGWLPLPDPGDTIEEPPMEPVQTWGRSSGGARGWLPLPDGGVEAGRGLIKTEDPATLHLDIATQNALGGVIIAPQPGLAIDQTGNLTLERATPNDIGGIQDAPDDKPYSRKWGEWVPTEGSMEEPPMEPVQTWGRSSGGARGWLPLPDPGNIIEEPPMDPVQTWGRSSGGVRGWLPLPDGGVEAGRGLSKTDDPATLHLEIATQNALGGVIIAPVPGLAIDQTGNLTLERASPTDLGGIVDAPYDDAQPTKSYSRRWGEWVPTEPGGMDEPPADPVALWGRSSAGARGWLEVPTFDHLTGFVEKIGDTMQGFLTLHDNPIEPFHAATRSWVELEVQLKVDEPPNDDIAYARKWKEWVPVAGSEAGRGLTADGNTLHLDIATQTDLGGVFIPPQQGLEITQVGGLTLARATPEDIGGLVDAPRDDTGTKQYARKWGQWVETEAGIADAPPDFVYGRTAQRWIQLNDDGTYPAGSIRYVQVNGDTMRGSLMLAHEGALAMEAVTVSQLERQKVEAGIGLAQIGPRIDLRPATKIEIGGIYEAPDDGVAYVRQFGQWEKLPPGQTPLLFRYGLVQTNDIVDVKPATNGSDPSNPPELGGVYATKRDDNQGLTIDGYGHISVPLATDLLAGSIVEPPPDAKGYVRTTQLDGTSQWVPPAPSAGGVTISDTPPVDPAHESMWWESDTGDLFIFYEDPSGPPGQWVQVNGESAPPGVYVADDPPMTPTENQLWFDSNAGSLNLWYTDPDSSQWVQVAGPPPAPGIAEAPVDGVPYSRQDATWVATTALAATPGDVKQGFQVNDHAGWVKLDGRAVVTLTVTQQAEAALLGFTTNIPDATGSVLIQNGGVMGAVSGNMAKTIAVANLPAHNMTSGGHDAAAVTSSSAGAHDHFDPMYGWVDVDAIPTGVPVHCSDEGNRISLGGHTHTIDMPNHTHTVALGGSGTPLDCTPRSLSVNVFVYLGT